MTTAHRPPVLEGLLDEPSELSIAIVNGTICVRLRCLLVGIAKSLNDLRQKDTNNAYTPKDKGALEELSLWNKHRNQCLCEF